MDKKKIVENLFDKKVIKILRLFINNSDKRYYLREISRITKVSPASTYRILVSMKEMEILNEYKDKHLKTYALNEENATMFSHLLEDKTTAIEEFVKYVKRAEGVHKIIKHGQEERNKANILIIGLGIDEEEIRKKVVDLKEKYNFSIIFLVLQPEQYEQMNEMGLYPGEKEVLYEK